MKLSCLNRYLVFVSSFITLSTFSSVIYANGDYLIRQGLQELVQELILTRLKNSLHVRVRSTPILSWQNF